MGFRINPTHRFTKPRQATSGAAAAASEAPHGSQSGDLLSNEDYILFGIDYNSTSSVRGGGAASAQAAAPVAIPRRKRHPKGSHSIHEVAIARADFY